MPGGYDQLTVDGELASEVRNLMNSHPGRWPSRRAAYHDLLRRGIESLSPLPSPMTPPTPTAGEAPEVPPSASASPSGSSVVEVAPGDHPERGEERVAVPEDAPGHSEGDGPRVSRSGSNSPPETPAPPRDVTGFSTWTCPKCKVTMPLLERWSHNDQTHPTKASTIVEVARSGGSESGGTGLPEPRRHAEGRAEPSVAAAKSVAPKKSLDLERLVRYVKMFVTSAKESPDRRGYLAAAIQGGHHDQGLAISDAEALELVDALAAREPAIERVLESPTSLAPPSTSTRSRATKGGDRGRTN